MKTLIQTSVLVAILVATALVLLFFREISEYTFTSYMYLIVAFVIFLSTLWFSLYMNSKLFAKKIAVFSWTVFLSLLIILQALLWIPQVYFFTRNPDLSKTAGLLLTLVAALNLFNFAGLMYYRLKNPPANIRYQKTIEN